MAMVKETRNVWTMLWGGLFAGIDAWDRARKSTAYQAFKKAVRKRKLRARVRPLSSFDELKRLILTHQRRP